MKKYAGVAALVLSLGAFAAWGDIIETVLYEFETGDPPAYSAQGWFSFGVPTTDSGSTNQAAVGGYARFHSFNMNLGGWGIGDRSPSSSDPTWGFGDLNPYVGISAYVKLTLGNPPTTIDTIELMLAIGDAEWTSFHTLTSEYQQISARFVDLIPQGTATEPITSAQLADPNLQIKLVMRRGSDTGRGVLRYDHICAWVPEPGALTLLAMVGLMGLRRR